MNPITLFGNILWILGLAIILTTLGWRFWQVRLSQTKSFDESNRHGLNAGIFLFCLGILLSTSQPWARILFLLLVMIMIVISVVEIISPNKEVR